MKKNLLLACGIFIFLISCGPTNAQLPNVSKTYKAEEVKDLITNFLTGQSTDIISPEETVAKSFKKDFSNATDIEWENLANNFYEVEFDIKGTDYNAFYNAKGNLLMYRFDITRSAVPKQVKEAVKMLYKGYRLDDAEKIVTAHGNIYEITVEKGESEAKIFFHEDGSILN